MVEDCGNERVRYWVHQNMGLLVGTVHSEGPEWLIIKLRREVNVGFWRFGPKDFVVVDREKVRRLDNPGDLPWFLVWWHKEGRRMMHRPWNPWGWLAGLIGWAIEKFLLWRARRKRGDGEEGEL